MRRIVPHYTTRKSSRYHPPLRTFVVQRRESYLRMSLTYLGKNNLSTTPWTADLVERLTALWAEGYTATQVVNELADGKITRSAVIGKVHRLGLPRRKPRQPAQYRTRESYRRGSKPPKPPLPQPPKPPPPPPSPGLQPKMRRLPFFKLGPRHCHWPLGSLLDPPRLFCGGDTNKGEVYCPHHKRASRVRSKQDDR
jgi:GcrA cell cycle regulator